jgi:hypothetical protein
MDSNSQLNISGLNFENAVSRIIPNHEQSLLISAAILPEKEAFIKWCEWKDCKHLTSNISAADIYDILDDGSVRLLPLIFRNLEHSGDKDILLLKSNYKYHWVKNQKAIITIQKVLDDFTTLSIDYVLLKGLSVLLAYYKDVGVRVTGDYDILIPESQKERVVQYFKSQWQIKITYLEYLQTKEFHAVNFKLPQGVDIDVHWHLNYENGLGNNGNFFIQNAVYKKHQSGLKYKILPPAHLVFHTIIHGISLSNINAIRWITDCVIIDKHETIDWQAVSELCIQYNYKLPFAIACKVLPSFGINIPITVTSHVTTWSFTKKEIVFYNLIASYKGKKDSWYNKIVGTYYYKKAMYNQFRKGNTKQVFMVWYLKSFILAVAIWLRKRL